MRNFVYLLFAVAGAGCATQGPAAPHADANSVRLIAADDASACKFVTTIHYFDTIVAEGEDPSVNKSIAEQNLKRKVAASGANAFVVVRNDSNFYLGRVSYDGKAYACP